MARQSAEANENNYEQIEASRRNRRVVAFDPITPAQDKERLALETDLEQWLLFFNPESYPLPFSPDHLNMIRILEDAINGTSGESLAVAMPRGSGKTTIAIDATLFALLTGKRKFPFVICSDKNAATNILNSIKVALDSNEKLMEYYPEACAFFRALQGTSRLAAGQLNDDEERTLIDMKSDRLTFPRVSGSRCSESHVRVEGITGSIRGARFNTSEGKALRPDFVIIDDPSTNESAKSAIQNRTRLEIINSDILGLGGAGSKAISCVCCCTVIAPEDLASTLLDKELSPSWKGIKAQMVYKFPESTDVKDLVDEYQNLYRDELIQDDDHKASDKFYKKKQKEIEAEVEIGWPERKHEEDISAFQHALKLIVRVGENSFWSEYQNQPVVDTGGVHRVTPKDVVSALNGLPRYVCHKDTEVITTFVDLNYRGLNYCVTAWRGAMIGEVIDWGKFPRGSKMLIEDASKLTSQEIDAIFFEALTELHTKFSETEYATTEGQVIRPSLSLVDIGNFYGLVDNFTSSARFPNLKLYPARGFACAKYKQTNVIGRVVSNLCHIAQWSRGKIKARVLHQNSCKMKEASQKGFLTSPGNAGSISLWGDTPRVHNVFAQEVCAEKLVEKMAGETGEHYVWRVSGHNDLLDALSGSMAAAAALGIQLFEVKAAPAKQSTDLDPQEAPAKAKATVKKKKGPKKAKNTRM
jgi:hypothetical protein